jgi:hypothetical protein
MAAGAHPARAERADDLVRAQTRTCGQHAFKSSNPEILKS